MKKYKADESVMCMISGGFPSEGIKCGIKFPQTIKQCKCY
jgi:hypothetical protein